LCNFVPETSDFQWQFATGRIQIGDTVLPLTDHTTRRPEGHFMYGDLSTGSSNTGYGRIGTPGNEYI